MINLLENLELQGHGVFNNSAITTEANFTIHRQLSKTIIIVEEEKAVSVFSDQFNNSPLWTLSGQLKNGRIVSAERLMLAGVDKLAVEILPLSGIVFGEIDTASLAEARYPLIGLFQGELEIEQDGWRIEVVDSNNKATLAKKKSKLWQIPLEGLELILKKTNETLENYNQKAREIMLLLSLAVGNGVTSYRQIANWGTKKTTETWREMTGDEFGPGYIIPHNELGSFLKQSLTEWGKWNSDKKSDARLAISYINLSGKGYLDSQIFEISQAWEFLAASWMPKGDLSVPETDLRNKIKSSYRQWKRENPEADLNGLWGDRIVFPFKWPAAKRQIKSLIESRNIDLEKITGLDFEYLKKARDSVAHNGKMPEHMTNNQEDTHQLLAAAQFGLQLLLVADLGYNGLIASSSEGWRTYVSIDTFFK